MISTRRRRTALSIARSRPQARTTWPLILAAAVVGGIALQELVARLYYRLTPPPERLLSRDERTAWTPAWRELRTPVDWLALRRSAIYRDDQPAPAGDGAPVLLVPGFLTKGGYLGELRGWLRRVGYDAAVADIGWNADCFDVLADRLAEALESARRRSGRRTHLVGHSLGGVFARSVAARLPHLVGSLTVLASPVRGMRLHPALRMTAAVARASIHARRGTTVPAQCGTLACDCKTVRALATALPDDLPYLSVAATSDGLTDWRYALDGLATRTSAVRASHVGVVLSRETYEALAHHLAGAAYRARSAS